MVSFVLSRAWHSVLVLSAVLVLVFFVGAVIGDPVDLMLPIGASEATRDALRSSLGFDKPLPGQFVDFVARVGTGFGDSIGQGVPALGLVLARLPYTLYLAGVALLIAIPLSLALGALAAMRPNSIADRAVNVFSLGGVSIVDFWLGLMLILVFGAQLGWLPTGGYGGGSLAFVILPALTLAYRSIGRLAQFARSALLDEYAKPYVDTLRGKGMSEAKIFRHTMKNAAIPVITLSGDEMASLVNGAIVVEAVFAWPGIGGMLLRAIAERDLFLLEAVVFVMAATVIIINFLIDLTYGYLDPKVRSGMATK